MPDSDALLTATALALLDQAQKGDGTEAPSWVALMPDLVEAIDPHAEHLQRSGLCLLAGLAFHGKGPVPGSEVERWMVRLMDRGAAPFRHLNSGLNDPWRDHPCAFLAALAQGLDGFCAEALARCPPDPAFLTQVRLHQQGLVWQVAQRGMVRTLARLLDMGLPPEGLGCEGVLGVVSEPAIARMLLRSGASTETPNRQGQRPRETWHRLDPALRQTLELEVLAAAAAGETPRAEAQAIQGEALLQAVLKADLTSVDRLWREGVRDSRALAVAMKGACAPGPGRQHNLVAVLRLLKLDPDLAAREQPLLHLFSGLCGHFSRDKRGLRCLEQVNRLRAYVQGTPKPAAAVRALGRLVDETRDRGERDAFSKPLKGLLAHKPRNVSKVPWLQPLLNLAAAEGTGHFWYRYNEDLELTQLLRGMEPAALCALDPTGWTKEALVIAIGGAVQAGLDESSETGRALAQCVADALPHHPYLTEHVGLLDFLNTWVSKKAGPTDQVARSWLAVLAHHTLGQSIGTAPSEPDVAQQPQRPRL